MKVLITGANGMLARAAIRHCWSIGDDVTALTRVELDIGDREAVFANLEAGGFDAVLNCAAYTDVDGAESNEAACYRANAVGVENLAKASKVYGAAFVTVSTDYVFDGQKSGFYRQADEPKPQGVYARSKLEGEQLASAANESSIIVRSGWIFGHDGTNFLSIMHRLLADGKRIKAIEDSYGTPTLADDLARRMRELAEKGEPGVFHVTNRGEGTSYLGFAEAVCDICGYDRGQLDAVSNDDLQRPAPRPKNSRLACNRATALGLTPLPDWENALTRFLTNSD